MRRLFCCWCWSWCWDCCCYRYGSDDGLMGGKAVPSRDVCHGTGTPIGFGDCSVSFCYCYSYYQSTIAVPIPVQIAVLITKGLNGRKTRKLNLLFSTVLIHGQWKLIDIACLFLRSVLFSIVFFRNSNLYRASLKGGKKSDRNVRKGDGRCCY